MSASRPRRPDVFGGEKPDSISIPFAKLPGFFDGGHLPHARTSRIVRRRRRIVFATRRAPNTSGLRSARRQARSNHVHSATNMAAPKTTKPN